MKFISASNQLHMQPMKGKTWISQWQILLRSLLADLWPIQPRKQRSSWTICYSFVVKARCCWLCCCCV